MFIFVIYYYYNIYLYILSKMLVSCKQLYNFPLKITDSSFTITKSLGFFSIYSPAYLIIVSTILQQVLYSFLAIAFFTPSGVRVIHEIPMRYKCMINTNSCYFSLPFPIRKMQFVNWFAEQCYIVKLTAPDFIPPIIKFARYCYLYLYHKSVRGMPSLCPGCLLHSSLPDLPSHSCKGYKFMYACCNGRLSDYLRFNQLQDNLSRISENTS